MTRYVALLGSINVGGNRLTMAELRAAFEGEDFANVETVVASGNVLFDHEDRPTPGLEEKLEFLMRDRFDMQTIAAVRNAAEIRAAIEDNPFTGQGADANVHTMFLDGPADPAQFAVLVADQADRGPEKLAFGDRALYVERGTMENERILPLADCGDQAGAYFAMILIPGQGRRL